jgi:nickel-dependent lactate racemase
VRPEDVTILVGTGTHRAPTEAEVEQMLGEFRREFHVSIHDCDRDLVKVGESSRGTPLLVNRLVTEADRVVTIGHIGMHYYAGYTGGRKNILPGVAGRETIETNHAQLTDPRCEGCVYEGNPISEEMSEAARLVGIDYIDDVVLGLDGQVGKVVIGEVEEAHAAGRAFWDTLHHVKVSTRADLVIVSAGGHPHDINLYQAYKGLYNAAKAVKDGGMILWIAACPDSIGHSVFSEWMLRCCDSPDEVFGILQRDGFKLGGHKAFYLAKDLQRAEIYLHSEMEKELVRRLFLKPASDPKEILAIARKQFGEEFRILVMPNGGGTFPILDGNVSL